MKKISYKIPISLTLCDLAIQFSIWVLAPSINASRLDIWPQALLTENEHCFLTSE
mgnify:CR=1 FL=1